MNSHSAVVAVFDHHRQAEDAVKKLADAGIEITKVNIVGKGCHTEEKAVGFYNAGDRIKFWGKYGAFWGSLWGLFVGSLFMTVPVIGPIVVLGHLGAIVLGAVEGAALGGGMSALGAALFSIGIPKNTVIDYETAVRTDSFLVMVDGSPEEVERAKIILTVAKPSRLDVHEDVSAPAEHSAHHSA
ncbi:hypothetical protein PY365_27190 [Roseiarcaceae bacterium H3SJ34-1]|uniref:general stress protein n=1 Tax=Terripilifer ovatus TaxID=3032367 RepID=UPI003AB93FF4|nr:hypothetical protein [Roseiarcaceae bacterium H3SJ34-1]